MEWATHADIQDTVGAATRQPSKASRQTTNCWVSERATPTTFIKSSTDQLPAISRQLAANM